MKQTSHQTHHYTLSLLLSLHLQDYTVEQSWRCRHGAAKKGILVFLLFVRCACSSHGVHEEKATIIQILSTSSGYRSLYCGIAN